MFRFTRPVAHSIILSNISLLFVIVLWNSATNSVFAQNKDKNPNIKVSPWNFSVQAASGFLMAHSGSLQPIVKSYTHSLMLEAGYKTSGQNAWHQFYHYPTLGFGYYYSTLGNDEVLGRAQAIYGYIDAPYYDEKAITLSYKFGFGLSYLSKRYDIQTNIYNPAIGSHINVYAHFGFDARFRFLKNRLIVNTGPGFSHMSNGKIQTPNLGLNIIDWHLGIRYALGTPNLTKSDTLPQRPRHKFIGIWSGGAKEFTEPNHGKYFASTTTLDYEYAVGHKISWGLGFDYFYDGVAHQELIEKSDNNPFWNSNRYGIHAAYSIYYGRVSYIIQLGSYIAPQYTDYGFVFTRIGLRAQISKHLLFNVSMKTHWARADIVEFGLGYYIEKSGIKQK